jgi:hypothetical protein
MDAGYGFTREQAMVKRGRRLRVHEEVEIATRINNLIRCE